MRQDHNDREKKLSTMTNYQKVYKYRVVAPTVHNSSSFPLDSILRKMAGIIYLFVVALALSSVDADSYCQLNNCKGRPHTLCLYPSPKPANQCVAYKSASLTEEEKNEIRLLHNKLRNRVASGRETRGINGPQPAGYIPPLEWDEELAEIAQRWANQCTDGHDQCRNVERFPVGQNVGRKGWSNGYNAKVSEIVQAWYDEVENFDSQVVPSFRSSKKLTGHYTQLVWGETTRIGCGLMRYKRGAMFTVHLVCNYGPAGNWLDEPIYQTR
ncbi:venom allergen 3 [Fopius arisanus]|uniref:Venom allergen 3 n=1 Tax=Fopius arisanus TaxID=64838 RepID=A0A9R1TW36_9HYME|nr:PREDICTED: venom allergen 3-like [Fopius arisanus]